MTNVVNTGLMWNVSYDEAVRSVKERNCYDLFINVYNRQLWKYLTISPYMDITRWQFDNMLYGVKYRFDSNVWHSKAGKGGRTTTWHCFYETHNDFLHAHILIEYNDIFSRRNCLEDKLDRHIRSVFMFKTAFNREKGIQEITEESKLRQTAYCFKKVVGRGRNNPVSYYLP